MNERILNAFLEEALDGAQPPDLTDRIVAALGKRRKDGEAERQGDEAALLTPRPILLPTARLPVEPGVSVAGDPVATFADRRDGGDVRSPLATGLPSRSAGTTLFSSGSAGPALANWLPVALAASLLLAIGGYWAWNRRATDPSTIAKQQITKQQIAKQQIAKQPVTRQASAIAPVENITVARQTEKSGKPIGQNANTLAGSQQPAAAPPASRHGVPDMPRAAQDALNEKRAAEGSATGIAISDRMPPADATTAAQGEPELDPSSAGDAVAAASLESTLSESASTDAQVIAYINAALKDRWKEAGIRPSPPATESEWCRRVYLDLIGRIPTVDELQAFLIDNRRDKRTRLVDMLLDDDRYVESYARFWTTLWTNRLIGRKGGMEANSPVNREGLQQYLRRSFLANKPYQRMAYELISAKGSNRPLEVAYNGAVNFLLAQMQEKATPATAKTAQIFLGLQVQCTQCHNHPFNEWKQNRFWELNAFFRQMREERSMEGNQLKSVRLLDADFAGESGDPREAEVYFELRNGITQVAYPTFIDGTAIDPNGLVSAVDRRRELARFVSRSDELKLAIVNWLWSHFFGYGFTRPVDDMGPHNPPSHPELLARLADEFAGHGYDLKRLARWITLCDAYGLSSRFGQKLGNAADDPTLGNPALFSHFYLRQMSAEQLYDSLLVATGAHLTQVSYEEQQRTKDHWLEQFAIAFGTDENDETTTFDGTITQTLVMMNGELTRQATDGESGNFLSQVSKKSERAAALNELYLAALARRPSRQEVQVANNLLTAQAGNASTALEDIWWALLNSNEFILNH